jgi:phosphoserine phosphatase
MARALHAAQDPSDHPRGRRGAHRPPRRRGDGARDRDQPLHHRADRGGAGIENLIATDIEEEAGVFTGKPRGTPCFREGKIENLRGWLAARGERLEDYESWFYSDSLNDLPLLELVDHPVAVDPDATLAAQARERGWPVISLR